MGFWRCFVYLVEETWIILSKFARLTRRNLTAIEKMNIKTSTPKGSIKESSSTTGNDDCKLVVRNLFPPLTRSSRESHRIMALIHLKTPFPLLTLLPYKIKSKEAEIRHRRPNQIFPCTKVPFNRQTVRIH